MRPGISSICVLLFVWLYSVASTAATDTLDIYFIDVEGGQATLIVTPNGESLLFDAGYPGKGKSDPVPGDPGIARDPRRVLAAAEEATLSHIDYLLVSHFHGDHFGGAMELSELIPIGTFIDSGSEFSKSSGNQRRIKLLENYEKVRAAREHLVPVVGDRLILGDTEIRFVSSAGSVIDEPLEGAGNINPFCQGAVIAPSENVENPRSTGILLRFGEFRLLNLGDLVGQPLYDLACPENRIGTVDVYLVPHHAGADAADPVTLEAFRPRIAVINNGATKGGAAVTFEVLENTRSLEDVWQLHHSENTGVRNFPAENIANLDTSTAHWLKLSAKSDGSFSVFNPRTGKRTRYGVSQ